MSAIQSTATATIAAGQSMSAPVWIGSKLPVSLMFNSFTGTEVSFQGSVNLSTYRDIHIGGAPYTVPVTQGTAAILNSSVFAGFIAIKMVSNATEAVERTVTVLKRRADQ